tara:strand:- start:7067 stop:8455 length:1389 start_codon:yes stop_codon:yes gene_type:complete
VTNLGAPKIDLTRFFKESSVHEINGRKVDSKELINGVSMISMKINQDNVDSVKHFTSEGLSKEDRLNYVQNIKDALNSDVFEMSTCNRVLFVGFGVDSKQLESAILEIRSVDSAPFEHHNGLDVWRHLVKVCSGLDSFIIGELQVMSQFRGSVALHRQHGLVSDINSSFFDHVISANRIIRREFGFTQTTESMLNLATAALEEAVAASSSNSSVVLGFGDMGSKAIEVLLDLGQSNIVVITRSPTKAIERNPELSSKVKVMTFEDWRETSIEPNLVISTIRNNLPTFDESNPLPFNNNAMIMDFSWPPSIDKNGVSENQQLYGMEHWIRVAHRLGIEWDYSSIVTQSETLISEIQKKFMAALTDRSRSKFRAYMYQTLEKLSVEWESSEFVENSGDQLGAFSREIATWICNQEGPFSSEDLTAMMMSTKRPFNTHLLLKVANDVNDTINGINEMSTFPGENS